MLKNATVYTLSPEFLGYVEQLAEHLATHRLAEILPTEQRRLGFVSPLGDGSPKLVLSVAGTHLFTLGGWQKSLPGKAINAAAEKRINAMEEAAGEPVARRVRREIHDAERARLLAQAIATPFRINAYIDTQRSLLVVGTATAKQADEVVMQLRQAIGTCQAVPVSPDLASSLILTRWVLTGVMPEGITLGEEIELRDKADRAAVIRGSAIDLQTDEIRQHAEAGRRVTRLGLVVDGRFGCVLDERLVMRKTRLLDLGSNEEGEGALDRASAMQAELVVFAGAFGDVYDRLSQAFSEAA